MNESTTIAAYDREALQDLGRACSAIVHDTRNDLNALKLYATLLLKRSQQNEWRLDEREILAKLFAGLEQSAGNLTLLARFSRPITLAKMPQTDVQQILTRLLLDPGVATTVVGDLKEALVVESYEGEFFGEFDPVLLSDALKAITVGGLKLRRQKGGLKPLQIRLTRDESESGPRAAIKWEWPGFHTDDLMASDGTIGVSQSLAMKIVAAHGGTIERHADFLKACLPLSR